MSYGNHTAYIEITKESGEIVHTENCLTENQAQTLFDDLAKIKYPMTYKNFTMNLSEYPEGRVGSVRLVVEFDGNRYIRRELFRKP